MAKIIAMEREKDPWVVGEVGSSAWIMNGRMNFTVKARWTLVDHMLKTIYGDNVLSPE